MESPTNSSDLAGSCSSFSSNHTAITTTSSSTGSPLPLASSGACSALSSPSCALNRVNTTTTTTTATTPSAPVTPSSCVSAGEAFFSHTRTVHLSPSSALFGQSPEYLTVSSSPSRTNTRNSTGLFCQGVVGGESSSTGGQKSAIGGHCCAGEDSTRLSRTHSTETGEGRQTSPQELVPGGGASVSSQQLSNGGGDSRQSRLSSPPPCHLQSQTGESQSSGEFPPPSSGLGDRSQPQQTSRGMSLSNSISGSSNVGLLAGGTGVFGCTLSYPATSSSLVGFGNTRGQFVPGVGCASETPCDNSSASADSSATTTTTTGQQQQQQQASHQQRTQQEGATNTGVQSGFPPLLPAPGTGGGEGVGNAVAAPFSGFATPFSMMGTDGLFFSPALSQNSTSTLSSPSPPGGGGTTPPAAAGVGGGGGVVYSS